MQIYAPTAFPHFWDFSGIFLGFFCDFFLDFVGFNWDIYGMWTWMAQKWDFYGIFFEFYGNKVGNLWNVDLDDPKVGFFLWDFYGINMGLL